MGFTPLATISPKNGFTPGFTPLPEDNQPSVFAPAVETIKDIGRVYPALETAGNLATQAVAMPVAGIAGLGAAATKAIGLSDTDPSEVIHNVANALTYHPQTEAGKQLANAAMYPFEKLQEAGQFVGGKTLEATGSPALATVADTAINALPMALPMKAAEPKGVLTRAADNYVESLANEKKNQVPVQDVSQADAIPSTIAQDTTIQANAGSPIANSERPAIDPAAQVFQKHTDVLENAIEPLAVSADAQPAGFTPLDTASAKIESAGTPKIPEQAIDLTSVSGMDTPKEPINKVKQPAEMSDSMSINVHSAENSLLNKVDVTQHDTPNIGEPPVIEQFDRSQVDTQQAGAQYPQKIPEAVGFKQLETGANQNKPSPTEIENTKGVSSVDSVAPEERSPVVSGIPSHNNILPDTAAVDSRSSWAPGANYTGFVDKVETKSKLAENPIRREDVLAPLLKDLGIRIYEGRVKGKRLGFYMPKLEAVRIKNKSDLEVAAHEIAHAIDDRIPEIRAAWLKGDKAQVHAQELKGVSYDKSKVYEGFAEFTRLYMTQPEKAKAAAPNFYQWFDNFTQTHKYGPAIQKAQEGMTSWFNQDALHRAQSKIGKTRVINEALDGAGDKFRQAVVDDLHGLYRMEQQLTGKIAPVGAYETARLTRGAGGLVDGSIRLGSPVRKANGSFDFQGKGLEKILEPVAGNLDDFLMYAVGRSSHELMQQGREKLFTPAEIRSMLQLKKPEYETAFHEYQQWNKGVLDFAENMGVINKQSRAMWQRSQYLPYYRVGQTGSSASKGGAQGNWSGIQALTGGTDNLRDILGNMTQNAATLIDTALKNEARAKIAKLAEAERGGGNFLVKIDADSKQVKIDREQVKDKMLEALGIDPAQVRRGNVDASADKLVKMIEQQIDSAPGMFEFMIHGQTPKGNIMAVLNDGKPTYYEVADPLLYRAVSSLNRAPQHWIVRLLGLPKRIGQTTITLTPDFMVANIARDTIMGAVMSRAGFRPFVDSAKGMISRIKQDASYREYLANGGGFASYLTDENTFRSHLDRFYTSKGINPKTVLDMPDKVMYFIETLADSFEMSTRLGEYKRMREQGAHPRHAAYVSRDISTDFAMKGDSQSLGALYDTVMFLRPAVVSMDRLYRGIAHDPNKGAIAAKAGTIALLSAWLYWHNKDNPKYDDLDDWDKDSYWHFFVPVNGQEEHFRYPKIWEIGALASLSERTVAKLNDQEPEYGKAIGRILKNLFNMNMMPQAIAPLYEQATNRNGFTNAPIETAGMENIQGRGRAPGRCIFATAQ